MTKKIKYFVYLLTLTPLFSIAQSGISHEIGVFAGGVAFQSDFGVRHDFGTNAGNTGFGIGLVHYLNFAYSAECSCYTPDSYFNDHFKLRTELSYNSTKLEHFGEYVDKNSLEAQKLKGMKGEAKVTDFGMQLEYYPLSVRDFTATNGAFAPFIGLGAHFSMFKNNTTIGPLGAFYAYQPYEYSSEGGTTWSIVSSLGSRYKLSEMADLFVELRWQYYGSDWVDGLRKDPSVHPENKANDWNIWFHFGYIYYLD